MTKKPRASAQLSAVMLLLFLVAGGFSASSFTSDGGFSTLSGWVDVAIAAACAVLVVLAITNLVKARRQVIPDARK